MNDRPKIVALRGAGIGDCLLSFPSFRLLREHFPAADLTIVCERYCAPVYAGSIYHDRVAVVEHQGPKLKYFADLLRLRRRRFDLLLDFLPLGRSRTQTALIGAKKRIGFQKKKFISKILYTDTVQLDKSVHVSRREAKLLTPLGIELGKREPRVEFRLPAEAEEAAARLLRENGVVRSFAILQVTSAPRPEYRIWPADRFARIAERLHALGFEVVIASGKATPAVQEVMNQSSAPIHNLSACTEIPVLAGLAKLASAYVGYNTGTMHLAAVFGTPIVALFDSPNDWIEYAPLTDGPVTLVRAPNVAEPPGYRMDSITSDEVIGAMDTTLCPPPP